MVRITEEHIERYVKYPETLCESQKEAIEKELETNTELRELADWFADFYSELDTLSKEEFGFTIPLFPISSTETSEHAKEQVLAAMSPATQASSTETVVTVISEENQIVARILRRENQYKLHLIRQEKPDLEERTLFTIEDLNMDFVLGNRRRIVFDSNCSLEELDWQRAGFTLRIPLIKYVVEAKHYQQNDFSKALDIKGNRVLLMQQNGNLIIKTDESHFDEGVCTRLLVSASNDKSETLFRIRAGSDIIIPFPDSKSCTLWFFS